MSMHNFQRNSPFAQMKQILFTLTYKPEYKPLKQVSMISSSLGYENIKDLESRMFNHYSRLEQAPSMSQTINPNLIGDTPIESDLKDKMIEVMKPDVKQSNYDIVKESKGNNGMFLKKQLSLLNDAQVI